jgi:predicted nucleic acid-binding Zn ribbon protein
MEKRDLALDLFKSFKTGITHKPNKPAPTPRVGQPSDPELISGVLNDLISDRDWDSGLAEGNLFVNWKKIVGDEISEHAQPISILDNVLTIQSSSTAWATQLQLISTDLLATIQKDATGVLIERLVIIGPQTPTWKKGVRTIRNARGPRDTYN